MFAAKRPQIIVGIDALEGDAGENVYFKIMKIVEKLREKNSNFIWTIINF